MFTCSFLLYVDRAYGDAVESSTEESSEDPPSPLLYRPYIPDELADRADIRAAFREAKATSQADRGQALIPHFLVTSTYDIDRVLQRD